MRIGTSQRPPPKPQNPHSLRSALPKINTVRMEMSLVPLHCNELLFYEMCILMREKGYKVIAMEMDSLPAHRASAAD
jgi:hypothetical protein